MEQKRGLVSPNMHSINELRDFAYGSAVDQYVKQPIREVHQVLDAALGLWEIFLWTGDQIRTAAAGEFGDGGGWVPEQDFTEQRPVRR